MESNNVSWTRTFQFCPVPIRSATAKRRPCAPKSVSPTDCRYNRDVYKTVDDISAIKVDYHSFCYEFLLCGSFVFMQLSLSWEKHFKNLWCHHIVKSSGWARTRGQDQQNKLRRAYSAGYVTWKLENFPGVRTSSKWMGVSSGFTVQMYFKSMAEPVDALRKKCIFWSKFFGACKHTSYRITLLSNHVIGWERGCFRLSV